MANIKISELPAAGSLTGTELVEAVQGGANVKTTLADIVSLFSGGTISTFEIEGTPAILSLQDTTAPLANNTWLVRVGAVSQSALDIFDVYSGLSRAIFDIDGRVGFGATPPTESKIYVFGGPSGANMDLRQADAFQTATVEVQAHDFETSFKSVYMQHTGSSISGTFLGSQNVADTGRVVFQGNLSLAAIYSKSNVPIAFGVNDVELMRLTDAGLTLVNPLAPTEGGTGLATLGTANQIIGVNSAGDGAEHKSFVAGNNVTVTHGAGTITVASGIQPIIVPCSDQTTPIQAATNVATLRMVGTFTLTEVRASLTTVSSSGLITIDINKNGTSILSTKLTLDEGEATNLTAETPYVLSDTALSDNDEITIDIDGAGTNATGLKVYLIGHMS